MKGKFSHICPSESGMSLVELVLVVAFVSIALVTLLNSMSVGLKTSVGSETISLSVQLAEMKMEEIRSDKAARGYTYLDEENYPVESDVEDYSGYSRQVSITDHGTYKEVTVTVLQNGEEKVSLTAIFTNY